MSNYFNQVPDFEYVSRLPNAKIGDYIAVKNLFKRGKLADDIFQDLTIFTKYEIEQAKKANTTPEKLRAKFKGATFDGPPFARQTREFDTPYTTKKGKEKISPSFFDKRQEFKIKDDGSVDPAGVKKRMGSRFFSAREKQYQDTLDQIEADKKAGKDTKALEQKANKYQRFLKKGARGAEGQKFLDKLDIPNIITFSKIGMPLFKGLAIRKSDSKYINSNTILPETDNHV